MPVETPKRQFVPIKLGGPLNESNTPNAVGSDGLTANNNLMYRRFGAWGKRPGSSIEYNLPSVGPYPSAPTSATRFYQAYYNGAARQFTRTVIAAQGALWVAQDPGSTPVLLSNFAVANTSPIGFCTARDPAANSGNGSDVLIIAGGSSSNASFATGEILFSSGDITVGTVITVTVTAAGGSPAITVTYTTLATDNTATVAATLSNYLNLSAAVVAGSPFMAQTFTASQSLNNNIVNAQIFFGALVGGSGGNSIGLAATVSNGSLGHSVSAMAGGGGAFYGPLKWDGNTLSGLSPFITNAFTGCVNWHNHVWFWGDPANPQTVFATDINQPEGFSFMLTEGGYDIGDGTGAQAVTACVPAGNILYAFNTSSSYAITGYDFQTGEYQFSIAPAISDSGVAYKECVTTLRNAIIYWDGTQFQKLVPGSFETEKLGTPIPFTCGAITNSAQNVIRAAAGRFAVQSTFGTQYFGTGGPTSSTTIYSNVALFGVQLNGSAAVLIYDEDASRLMGFPAWSTWTGFIVDAWLTFGSGHNAAGSGDDTPSLFWFHAVSNSTSSVGRQIGGNATADSGGNITFSAQTGWFDCGTPQNPKGLHRIFLSIEARAGVNLTGTVVATGPQDGTAVIISAPVALTWPTSVGQQGNETSQELIATIEPALIGYRFLLQIVDAGSQVGFEITGARVDVLTEALVPG